MKIKEKSLMQFIKRTGIILFSLCSFSLVFAQTAFDTRRYVDEGIVHLNEERYFRAIDSFRNAISQNPFYGDAYKYLASTYYALEEYNLSLQNALTALRYSHTDVDAMLLVANSYRELGDFGRAENFYTEIKEKFPGYAELFRNRGELYIKMNRFPLALQMLERARRYSPDNWLIFISFGDYYYKLRDMRRAQENYNRALQLNSRERQTFYSLAGFYYSTGGYKDAINLLERGEALFDNFVFGISLLGDSYLRNGNYRDAVEKYLWIDKSGFVRDDNERGYLYFKTALAYRKFDTDKATEFYRKALRLKPDNEFYLYSFEKFVLDNFRIGDGIRNDLGKMHYDVARNFYRKGDSFLYFVHLKRAILLNPYLEEAREALITYFENRRMFEEAYNELNALFRVNQSQRVRNRIENYDWRVERGQLVMESDKLFVFNGLIVVKSDVLDFSETIVELSKYVSLYFDKFKFFDMKFRKEDEESRILEYVRDNNLNFYVSANMNSAANAIEFSIHDKAGELLGKRALPYEHKDFENTVLRFLEWVDSHFPDVGFVSQRTREGNFRISLGENKGIKAGDEVIIFNDGYPEPLAVMNVVKSSGFYADCSVISNFTSQRDFLGKKVFKNGKLMKKHLTNLKRILVY